MPYENGRWTNGGLLCLLLLRIAAVFFTSTAALSMGFNKQSITKAVAIVGTKTLYHSYAAKFHQTPAFIFLVVANAVASIYNPVVLLCSFFSKGKALHNMMLRYTDLVVFAVTATGAAAGASMAELGRNGNLHARWSPICDQFGGFCLRSDVAIAASFVGAFLHMILIAVSLADGIQTSSKD
ncbi:hypothetical protein HPP92_017077 [Vanilla planifolia]|uniref:CASP-like protein n=1 Tax=Vanilla planifolia TaxID=51239 RepID=A0A835Q8N5_VANPL|nr:hypothetical protein HPP92_017077 [Vanilla planifolia]